MNSETFSSSSAADSSESFDKECGGGNDNVVAATNLVPKQDYSDKPQKETHDRSNGAEESAFEPTTNALSDPDQNAESSLLGGLENQQSNKRKIRIVLRSQEETMCEFNISKNAKFSRVVNYCNANWPQAASASRFNHNGNIINTNNPNLTIGEIGLDDGDIVDWGPEHDGGSGVVVL